MTDARTQVILKALDFSRRIQVRELSNRAVLPYLCESYESPDKEIPHSETTIPGKRVVCAPTPCLFVEGTP